MDRSCRIAPDWTGCGRNLAAQCELTRQDALHAFFAQHQHH